MKKSPASSIRSLPSPQSSFRLLAINLDEEVCRTMRQVFSGEVLSLESNRFDDGSLESSLGLHHPIHIVVADTSEADQALQLLDIIQTHCPMTPVVLLSDDLHVWLEAIQRGAYDLLPRRIEPDQLLWVLDGALRRLTGPLPSLKAATA
jgi:DNA-binding NtrC family response regulator